MAIGNAEVRAIEADDDHTATRQGQFDGTNGGVEWGSLEPDGAEAQDAARDDGDAAAGNGDAAAATAAAAAAAIVDVCSSAAAAAGAAGGGGDPKGDISR
jgi:hypothetical protein